MFLSKLSWSWIDLKVERTWTWTHKQKENLKDPKPKITPNSYFGFKGWMDASFCCYFDRKDR